MATFTKLQDGTWGIRGNAAEVRQGATVSVTKRDGSRSTVTVSRVLWSDGLNAIAATGQARIATAPARRPGMAAQVTGYAARCTDRPGCRCFDCE